MAGRRGTGSAWSPTPSPRRAAPTRRSGPGLETEIKEYRGVGGVFTFSPQKHWGLAKSDVVMIEWRQGKFRLVDL